MVNAETELFGIIGNPVRQSLSPVMHNGAFRRMKINAVYLAFEVRDLGRAVQGVRALPIRGLSVTIPYKTTILPLLDEIEDMASKMKAVNTLVNDNGRLIGYNTDSRGAWEALEKRIHVKGKTVSLLGAGGAARAIGFGLKERGCEITIFNRTPERASKLAKELGCAWRPLSSLGEATCPEADILIQATSAGMHPDADISPVPRKVLKKTMTVMDIVYRPLKTRLLREAEENGCQIIDGLEMLAYQGAAQLEIWTGRMPDVQEIQKDLRRSLGGEG